MWNLKPSHFENTRLLIVGDIMLDRYWHGNTTRISPEAPVPVVHFSGMEERLGGAANVALSARALGAQVTLLGVVGQDSAGIQITQLLDTHHIQHHLLTLSQISTTVKMRVMSRHHQMLRLDQETPLPSDGLSALYTLYEDLLKNVDLVILSDYRKGTLQEPQRFIQAAQQFNIPVLIDPKQENFTFYQGATLLTPNRKEFEQAVGPCHTLEDLVEKAHQVIQSADLEALIITRAEEGMSVISRSGDAVHIASAARDVYDVTGAGDTVIAVLGAALAAHLPLVQSVKLSNIAAGLSVEKLGTVAISVSELIRACEQTAVIVQGVVSETELLTLLPICRNRLERIIFTNGCFDLLHPGHVQYLEQARALGDRLIVGVNDDASVRRLKGSTRPINSLQQRMAVLAGLRAVDWVVSFSEDTPERLIQALSPHVLVKGGDYQHTATLPGAAYVLAQGGEVRILDLYKGCSTTQMVTRIQHVHEII